ncbi:MAG TPA: hypothetical protein VGN43_17285 [Steroidobacteraceae bacterium]|jgi:cytochrome c553|nr:hypothetical protein [Steroidobacteraceae bacterium]
MTMRSRTRATLALTLSAAAGIAVLSAPASADVTVGQKTSMSLGGINIDVDSVERTSAEKQRSDSTVTCHGLLSLFCHGAQGGRIVRLDKQLEWELQPQKKLYSERSFPTPGQRAAAQKQIDAAMAEMKKCPMPQAQGSSQASAPDTSHCQLSSPVLEVTPTDEHATILGHDTHKTTVVLSQTCTDTQTGDVCQIEYGFDTWVTEDEIPGTGERNAFLRKYLESQGLDPDSPRLQHTLQQFMAPYAGTLKQLQGKAADLKGYPLRTAFYMAFGGPHCGRAKQAEQQQQASSHSPLSMHGIASSALAGGLSGLFHRGAAAIHGDSVGGAAAASAANEASQPAADAAASSMAQPSSSGATAVAPAPGALIRVVSLTTETTSVDASSIPSDQFEIPADWKLEPQKQMTASRAPKCPTADK